MFDESGRLQDAKIDLETGEVAPHEYTKPAPRPKARRNPDAPDQEPFWTQPLPESVAPEHIVKESVSVDESRKQLDNLAQVHFENYARLDDALEVYPGLDNILIGALALDMGGQYPTAKEERYLHDATVAPGHFPNACAGAHGV